MTWEYVAYAAVSMLGIVGVIWASGKWENRGDPQKGNDDNE